MLLLPSKPKYSCPNPEVLSTKHIEIEGGEARCAGSVQRHEMPGEGGGG